MKQKFLIIGENCQDVFIYGSAKRLSPEAPVPVFVPNKTIRNDGMAKNVYQNILALIENDEVDRDYEVDIITSISSAEKVRYVDEKTNHYFLRVDFKDNQYDKIEFTDSVLDKIKDADTIIISDYNKGFMTEEDILKICQTSKPISNIFLDTKKIITTEILEWVDFVKMNEKEYESNNDALGILLYEFDKKIIITQGEKGAYYDDILYETDSLVTMDVSGAGDTFIASLAYQYSICYGILNSIRFANKMASKVVTKRGVSTI